MKYKQEIKDKQEKLKKYLPAGGAVLLLSGMLLYQIRFNLFITSMVFSFSIIFFWVGILYLFLDLYYISQRYPTLYFIAWFVNIFIFAVKVPMWIQYILRKIWFAHG